VQRQILELIKRLQDKHRMSVLFISHDLGLVGEIADHVVVMRDGVVREKGRVAEIFEAPKDATPRRCCCAARGWTSSRSGFRHR